MLQRLSTVLLGGLAAVALLATASLAVSAVTLHDQSRQLLALRSNALLPTQDLKVLSDAYAVNLVDASHKVRNGNLTFAAGAEAVAEAQRMIDRSWSNLLRAELSPDALALRPQAVARKEQADALMRDLTALVVNQDRAALDRLVIDRLYAIIDPLTEMIGAMLDAQVAASVRDAEAAIAASDRALAMMGVLALVALGLIVGIGTLVRLRVIRPVHALTRTMERMAAGELDAAVPATGRRDEIGDMARSVSVFQRGLLEAGQARDEVAARAASEAARTAALRDMADSVERESNRAIDSVAAQIKAMATEAEGVAQDASSVAAEIEQVSGEAQAARQNVQTVAAATEELGASIREIAHQVSGAAGSTRRAAERGVEGRTRIDALAQEVGRIAGVASVIADIAGRTNLLALNATIEAARAGDAGRGFAVVAGEVKALAAQTATATEEIARQVTQVTAATQEAVSIVQAMASEVGVVDEAAAAIAAAMEEQTATTQEIARAVAESAAATDRATRRMGVVAERTAASGARARKVQDTAAGARAAMDTLRHSILQSLQTAVPGDQRAA